MKRPGRVLRFAAPLKVFAQRFTFLGLIALSVASWSWARPRRRWSSAPARPFRRFIPVLDAVSRPVATVAEISDTFPA